MGSELIMIHPFSILLSPLGASLVAQLVKNLLAIRGDLGSIPGWEDSLVKGKATHSSILAWRIPWKIRNLFDFLFFPFPL